ncbi:unnamed protein product [Lactuca saligna]|uniref:Uncharacterized protein n=1 Tax=Lactuca saligna TaxID=75948 RepID=A0AA35Z876_LACSI|nr:unnamed protein product [Lactuca saligna]
MESEDIVLSSSKREFEEVHDSPASTMAEEHDHHKEDETESVHEEDDEDLYGDIEFFKEIDFTGINDDTPTNIDLDLDDEEFGPLPGFASSCLNNEPEDNRARITIKQGKRIVMANKNDGLLFMKNSNENRKAKVHVLTVIDLKKRKFGDGYGDRSGI